MNFIPPQDETRLRAAASGVLPNGRPVIVNADGTVSVAAENTASPSAGTAVEFDSNVHAGDVNVVYDTNSDRIVINYRDADNSNYHTAVVGTVDSSDNSISFGTPVVYSSSLRSYGGMTFDSTNNKVVIAFRLGTDGHSDYRKGFGIVGTVDSSNNSISFGSATKFEDAQVEYMSATFDSNAGKVVFAYVDNGNSAHGTAIVGTVSGTAISFGTAAVFNAGGTVHSEVVFDSTNNKVVFAYRDSGNSSYLTGIVGTVSGTAISFGSETAANNFDSREVGLGFAGNGKVVAVIRKDSDGTGHAYVGTVSGTAISFGSSVAVNGTSAINRSRIVLDESTGRVVIAYDEQQNSSKGVFVNGIVSGTSVTLSSATDFEAGNVSNAIGLAYDPDEKRVVFAFADGGDSSKGKAVVGIGGGTSTNLTAENYIGMSGGDVIHQEAGTRVTFESAQIYYGSSTYDTNADRVVIAYLDAGNSNYGTAVVGQVNGANNSISFGTPVVFESAAASSNGGPQITFDSSNNKVVIVFDDGGDSNKGKAIVGTVDNSDNSISFGSAAIFETGSTSWTSCTFDSSNNKVVIAYVDVGNSNYGKGVVATVSGTSISFGSITTFNAGTTSYTATTFDSSNNKVVTSFADGGDSNKGKAIVGTVSGTNVSFGSEAVLESDRAHNISTTFDTTNNKVIVLYGNPNLDQPRLGAKVGTVSGTDISFGDRVAITGSIADTYANITFDTSQGRSVIAYSSTGPYVGVSTGTVSGTSISFTDTFVVSKSTESSQGYYSPVYDPDANRTVVNYAGVDGSQLGVSVVYKAGLDGQVASGSSASVDIIGTVSENQTGLTAGQSYFVQTDGTIALTAGSPSVFAGTAISATKLLVKT